MAAPIQAQNTLIHAFLALARSDFATSRNVVECGNETWTYHELDVVSSGIATQLLQAYGPKPTVAFVTENHPFMLAAMFATWKLGGVIAPLDHHVPRSIMERMLTNIRPSCVVVSASEGTVQKTLKDLSFNSLVFGGPESTITALTAQFRGLSTTFDHSLPSEKDVGFILHTSSASSVANVKSVPLTHFSLFSGARARVGWWKKTWPQQEFAYLRVLGWSPWSHIIGLSHDIGAATILTAGCYVFGIIPSTYHVTASTPPRYLNVTSQLLQTAMSKHTTAFAGVPWVLEGFRRSVLEEAESARRNQMLSAIKSFKIFGSGGAATSPDGLKWASSIGLPLVLDLGMTELGGPLFHATINTAEGWSHEDCLLSDARLSLVDENGQASKTSEGELVIRSHIITRGYLNYDNRSFKLENDGSITFSTGDVYGLTPEKRLVWLGRKEDYIQMSSGESLDPREVESILNQSPAIVRSCIVGNNFLRTSSEVVCAIIEPLQDASKAVGQIASEINRAVGAANRALAPPLRIGWTRILILGQGQTIPVTKKGAIFRKKLEEMFGAQMGALLREVTPTSPVGPAPVTEGPKRVPVPKANNKTKDEVSRIVAHVVMSTLKISMDVLETNTQATFAELGMDSSMATKIVNGLNKDLDMRLPLNTCHTHIDLVSLTNAILTGLGLDGTAHETIPSLKMNPSLPMKEEIVIVGQSVRLPGDINSAESFWKALIDQREDIMTPPPVSRWDHASFYRNPASKDPPGPCDITLQKAGWVELAGFDHGFFGVSSAEAYYICPNIRLSMETAFEALENANIPASKVKGSNMGVFVAAGVDEGYIKLLWADKGWAAYTRFHGTGVATSTSCGRISYLLDVHGPSFTVDTACSSGLIALDHAVQYLRSGQGESAIVCGANTHTWPGTFGFLSAQKMTSSNSRCATYTNVADGYVPSEGAAGLILKTRSAALRDGDTILGVVKSTDVKHDGRSQGLVAPNVKAQIAMQIALLEKAGMTPSQLDFIEAHGTGTSLGDLIEIQGINEVFKGSHSPSKPLVVGAAKSCVGHAEVVSGLIGALKALGTFAKGTVPGLVQLNATNMNPSLNCSVVPLHIPHETAVLETEPNTPLKGMVLSNGFAGSIAGAIFEAPSGALAAPPVAPITQNIPMLFVVSAKSQEALTNYLNNYLDFCLNTPDSEFHSICYTSCVGREHYRYRYACVAFNMQDLISRLEERIESGSKTATGIAARRVLFAFPGQGSQYQGMGRYLAKEYSGFRAVLVDATEKASQLTGYPVLPFLLDETASGPMSIDQSEVAQVCIFLFQYAVSTWLENLGIEAQAVMGHSLGEIAAAVISRGFTLEQGISFVVARARILRADPKRPACMAAIAATEGKVASYTARLGIQDRAVIAVYNGVDAHVVSGEQRAVESLLTAVKQDGLRATKLNIDQGFHSPAIHSALPILQGWLQGKEASFSALQKAFFSTVKGSELPKNAVLDGEYWVGHAKNPVKFIQTARTVHKSTVDLLIDVGPQPTIWTNMQAPEFSSKTRIAVTGKKGKDQIVAMLNALAALFEKGSSVNFPRLFAEMPHKFAKTQIPTYPFQRLHNYPTYVATRHSILGVGHEEKAAPIIKKAASVNQPPFIADQALVDFLDHHRIEGRRVLPGAAMADFFARSAKSRSVRTIKFHKPLILEKADPLVRAEIDEKGSYRLLQKADRVCSGVISQEAPPRHGKSITKEPEHVPLQMISKTQVYECFKNVLFGDEFHTVQQVRIWEDHADGDIQIHPSSNSDHDRIRKLDACLHMFGAVASRLAPTIEGEDGAFLPTSLDDFTLHTEILPNTFTCRYYLPLDITRNGRLLSVSFDVFSKTGQLLVSCRKYSVAWVPVGVVIPEEQIVADPDSWLRNSWASRPVPDQVPSLPPHTFGDVVVVGETASARLAAGLSATANNAVFINLSDPSAIPNCPPPLPENVKLLPFDDFKRLPSLTTGKDMLFVLDLSKANVLPGSSHFSRLYQAILQFLQFVMVSKFQVSSFVVLTSLAAPVDIYAEGLDLVSKSQATSTSLIGAVVQGMMRVFRRERGLDQSAWCLDLPNVDSIPETNLQKIVISEIQARYRKTFTDTFVSYRQESSTEGLIRLVPGLRRIEKLSPRSPSGTAVIVGMGSIGSALAAALVSGGCSQVVFFGRRPGSNAEIQKELASLPAKARHFCSYRQVDVCHFAALKSALAEVNLQSNGVKHIVHTAAVVNDSTITATKAASFEDVLRPKIIGSWNLHNAAQELQLPLDSFALFSSTNVLVGNPGQVAYVSANSFMDSLATFRHNSGLPATSLQLGAWESKLTQQIDMNESFALLMKHKEGIPMIIKAMMVPIPLQIIARMDVGKLLATPAYAKDPFFAHLLKSKTPIAAPVPASRTPATPEPKASKDVLKLILDCLRTALELQPNERLDLAEPLTACGADSITFAQFKGKIMQELEVDVPMVYLAETYTINDMMAYILENYTGTQPSAPATTQPSSPTKQPIASVRRSIVTMLRSALDLQPNENLDVAEALTSCGGDSITFAQFKGQVLKELGVDVPMVYLSDAYTIDDMINNILEAYGSSAQTTVSAPAPAVSATRSSASAQRVIVETLRSALDLRPNETLDLAEPLTACGGDSITFAQFKGQILKEFEVDVPMVYLSEAYTINDMIAFILENYGDASVPVNPQPQASSQPRASSGTVQATVVKILRNALDLRPNEQLELDEPLTSCGGDSITFAQFNGQVLKEFGVDVPLLYLSDSFTINDMIAHIVEAAASA